MIISLALAIHNKHNNEYNNTKAVINIESNNNNNSHYNNRHS